MSEQVDFCAMDDSPEALAAANENYKILKPNWCECNNAGDFDRMAYYRDAKTGSHGWMCADCLGIVQTG